MPGQKLGQHWLADHHELEKISSFLRLKNDESCIEIGGGKGALSKLIAKDCKRLIIYEIDSKWSDHLREHSPKWGDNILIRETDALQIRWDRDSLGIENNEPLVITGNIPYYITSPLFLSLAYSTLDFDRAIFLIQKEVAERICAKHGDSEYSRLTVSLGAFLITEILSDVPPEAFKPPPKVMSSVISMVRHDEPLVPLNLVDLFERLVKQSFHMRRKMLRNNLKSAFPELNNSDILSLLAEAGIQREARPQEVSVESYVKLAELINVKSK